MRGGLSSYWWDFQSYGAEILGETITPTETDDPGKAWRERWKDGGSGNPYLAYRHEPDVADSGGKPRLKGGMPVYNGERLLNIAGFRGHAPAVYHACCVREWLFGSIEDAVSNAIVWLYEEWKRTGRNPADHTGHWPDARDYVCTQTRRALSQAARNEAPIASERPRVNGKREWTHGGLDVVPCSPVDETGDDGEGAKPPWDNARTWGQPNNPIPTLGQPGDAWVEGTTEDFKNELLAFVVDQVLTGLRQEAVISNRPADSETADVIERIRLKPNYLEEKQAGRKPGQIDGRTVRDVADELGIDKNAVQRALGRFRQLWREKAEAYGWNMSKRPSADQVAKARRSYAQGSGGSGGIWYGGDDKMPTVLRGVMR
jgi:hypothetical protein